MDKKTEKPSLSESFGIFISALKISLKTKSAPSIIVRLIGFPMALLPMLISTTLRRFSNSVQALSTDGAEVMRVLQVFALLAGFAMFTAYDMKNCVEYAKLCISARDGEVILKDYTNLGRVLDKRRGIYKNRELGVSLIKFWEGTI